MDTSWSWLKRKIDIKKVIKVVIKQTNQLKKLFEIRTTIKAIINGKTTIKIGKWINK